MQALGRLWFFQYACRTEGVAGLTLGLVSMQDLICGLLLLLSLPWYHCVVPACCPFLPHLHSTSVRAVALKH